MGRREDGYHRLQTLFVLLDYCDTLYFEVREDEIICRINTIDGIPEQEDLVIRAAKALQHHTGIKRGVEIRLEKHIPQGGGLGGGSSDAATTLLTLNKLWGCHLSLIQLRQIGATLGADVPVFISGHNAWAEGVGEELTPIEIPVWWYVVLTPPVNVPTAAIYGASDLTRDSNPLKITDFSDDLGCALRDARNDLQPVVLKRFPVVASYLEALQNAAAQSIFGARMTGSGACVFAAFTSEQAARKALAELSPEYKGFVAQGM